jgi:peptide chain release factor 1
MKEMAKLDLEENLPLKDVMDEEIKVLLIPKDPADEKNSVMEIRAGTGGDEASIFAGDLYRMYTAFAQSKGWKIELVDVADGTSGGYKEIIFNVS